MLELVGNRDVVFSKGEAEHLLQRPGDRVAYLGFFERGKAKVDRVGRGIAMTIVMHHSIAEVDQTEELKWRQIKVRI